MTLQGLIKARFKATQTRGGRVLTPVAAAVVGVGMWGEQAWASPVNNHDKHGIVAIQTISGVTAPEMPPGFTGRFYPTARAGYTPCESQIIYDVLASAAENNPALQETVVKYFNDNITRVAPVLASFPDAIQAIRPSKKFKWPAALNTLDQEYLVRLFLSRSNDAVLPESFDRIGGDIGSLMAYSRSKWRSYNELYFDGNGASGTMEFNLGLSSSGSIFEAEMTQSLVHSRHAGFTPFSFVIERGSGLTVNIKAIIGSGEYDISNFTGNGAIGTPRITIDQELRDNELVLAPLATATPAWPPQGWPLPTPSQRLTSPGPTSPVDWSNVKNIESICYVRAGETLRTVEHYILGFNAYPFFTDLKWTAVPGAAPVSSYRIGHTPTFIWPNCDLYKLKEGRYVRSLQLKSTGGARGPLDGFFGLDVLVPAPAGGSVRKTGPVDLPLKFDFTDF